MSWRFARTPKWLVRHVLVVVLVVVMVNLGFWQLRRLDEKKDFKALVEARQESPPEEVLGLVDADTDPDDPAAEEVAHRSVRATGTYLSDETVVVENRTKDGLPGGWVLTPLDLGGGTALLVNRGWVGLEEGAVPAIPPPEGTVEVEGLLLETQERGRFGPRDPGEGDLEVLARVDIVRIDEQVPDRLLPAYLQLVASDPAERAVEPLGPAEPEEGPHLSYAVQWFIFSTIAAGGYGLLLRKVAQDQAKPAAADA